MGQLNNKRNASGWKFTGSTSVTDVQHLLSIERCGRSRDPIRVAGPIGRHSATRGKVNQLIGSWITIYKTRAAIVVQWKNESTCREYSRLGTTYFRLRFGWIHSKILSVSFWSWKKRKDIGTDSTNITGRFRHPDRSPRTRKRVLKVGRFEKRNSFRVRVIVIVMQGGCCPIPGPVL